MAGRKSSDKGKRGERDAVELLKQFGFAEARRGGPRQSVAGDEGAPDVDGVRFAGFEVRVGRAVRLRKSIADALDGPRAASLYAEGRVPVLLHKDDRGDWCVTLKAADYLPVLRAVTELAPEAGGGLP